jgi:signal transduction histidine kinase
MGDALLAAALAVWALAGANDPAVGVPAALLMTLPLAWRRVAPLPVAVAVAAGFALQGAQENPPESLATLVAVMLAAYTVAGADNRRLVAAGLGALVAAGLAETALVGDDDYGFFLVVIAVASVAGFAMGARSRAAQAERQREAARAVTAERERIARELHDSVAHAVSLMVVQAGAAQTAVAGDREAAQALERIRATGQDAVADLGRMVGLLRDEVEPVHGIAQPERLVAPFRDAGMDVDLAVTGSPRALPGSLDSAAFRIAQEALTNALKHGAGSASLAIAYEPAELHVAVANPVARANGRGTGHGLAGMRERARLYGGRFDAGPTMDGRFRVDVHIPYGQ